MANPLPFPIPHGSKEQLTRVEQEVRYEYHRRRYLPEAIDSARRKVAALENEARRYGMHELLTNPVHVDNAWDEAIRSAQIGAALEGGSIGFGEAIR